MHDGTLILQNSLHIRGYEGKQTGAILPFSCSIREQQSTKIRLKVIYAVLKY